MLDTNATELDVQVTLAPQLFHAINNNGMLNTLVYESIVAEFAALVTTLGIPGKPILTIKSTTDQIFDDDQLLLVTVNGEVCPHSPGRVGRVYSYVSGQMLTSEDDLEGISEWLVDQADKWEDGQPTPVAEFLSLLSVADIRQQLASLLGPAQASRYLEMLSELSDDFASFKGADGLAYVLKGVLAVRLSLADHGAVAELIREGVTAGLDGDEITEILIAALSKKVEISLSQELLAELTVKGDDGLHEQFLEMREALFFHFGVYLPEFQFVITQELKPQSFAFRINDLNTLPWLSLSGDQYLVDDTVTNLDSFGISATPTINPLNGLESGLLDGSLSDSLSEQDLSIINEKSMVSYDPMAYLALCMSVTLREQRHCFMHAEAVQLHLEMLATEYPHLVKTVKERFSNLWLSAVLRSLLWNGQSILDLRLILEQLLDFDTINVDSPEVVVFDHRLPVRQWPDHDWVHIADAAAVFINRGIEYQTIRETTDVSDILVQLTISQGLEHAVDPIPSDQRLMRAISEFGDEQVREVIPWLLIASADSINFEELDEEILAIFEEFLTELDYEPEWESDQLLEAVSNYYTEHPLNEDLVNSLVLALKSDVPLDQDAYVMKYRTKYALG